MKRFMPALMLCLAGLAATHALAQTYPSKPIRLVVPFPPGGPTDILGRTLGAKLAESLGQPVIVDNRGGASGIIGTENVAKSPPDGHTLLLGATNMFSVNPGLYSKLPYDPIKDFAPISSIAYFFNNLVVNPNLPVKSVGELIALAKAKPGLLTYGSAGVGTLNHLIPEMLGSMAGVKFQHVPYKGSGPALNDVIGGQLDFMLAQYAQSGPHIKAGKVRVIGIVYNRRHALMPGVPTVAETVPGLDVSNWYGLFAPAGTPRETVNRLNAELIKVMKLPDIIERMAALTFDPVTNTPEEFTAQIKAEIVMWAEVLKKVGIKIDD